jgi:hypothetical protein
MSNNSVESHRTTRIARYRRRGNGVLLTADELAKQLGEEPRTIITWRQRGIIPWIDAGYRTKRYKLDDVLLALAKRTIREV